jgi:hypothetical protein
MEAPCLAGRLRRSFGDDGRDRRAPRRHPGNAGGTLCRVTRSSFGPLLLVVASCSSGSTSPPANGNGAEGTDAGPEASADTDTWANYAQGFFATYCTSCHNAQDPTGRDFTVQANVENDKRLARCGVAVAQDPKWTCPASPVPEQFPIGNGPKPSNADRARLVAWITAGAP